MHGNFCGNCTCCVGCDDFLPTFWLTIVAQGEAGLIGAQHHLMSCSIWLAKGGGGSGITTRLSTDVRPRQQSHLTANDFSYAARGARAPCTSPGANMCCILLGKCFKYYCGLLLPNICKSNLPPCPTPHSQSHFPALFHTFPTTPTNARLKWRFHFSENPPGCAETIFSTCAWRV